MPDAISMRCTESGMLCCLQGAASPCRLLRIVYVCLSQLTAISLLLLCSALGLDVCAIMHACACPADPSGVFAASCCAILRRGHSILSPCSAAVTRAGCQVVSRSLLLQGPQLCIRAGLGRGCGHSCRCRAAPVSVVHEVLAGGRQQISRLATLVLVGRSASCRLCRAL